MKPVRILCFLFLVYAMQAQDSLTENKHPLTIRGYVKELLQYSRNQPLDQSLFTSILHHRLNFKWPVSGQITLAAEFRNRLIWGKEVRIIPGYTALLRNRQEGLNLQTAWIQGKSMVLHTNVERLYAELRKSKWNLRIGRQRINWGMTTTWNPNDIFNTYNFLDIDYEERPGNDGAKFQYLVSEDSNLEVAAAYNQFQSKPVAAIKYAWNKWKYDVQMIASWYFDRPSLGLGWAGNIGTIGFKGESQYFFSKPGLSGQLNLSLEWSYLSENNWLLNLGFLYNNKGLYRPISNWTQLDLNLTPENLMPTRYNIIGTVAREITPLWSANLVALFAPGTKFLVVIPSIRYNLAPNLDCDLVWQSFFAESQHRFEDLNHVAFLRLKYSY